MFPPSGQMIQIPKTKECCPPSVPGRDSILSVMARVNDIARKGEKPALIEGTLDLLMEITQAESVNFFQLDPLTDEMVMTYVRGDSESQYLVGLRLKRQPGMPGIALSDSRVVVAGDLPTDLDWLQAVNPLSAARKRNVINLPIANNGRILGAVQIYNFDQAELDLLGVISDRLAIELERFENLETTRRSNKRLMSLVDMLGEIAGTLDRNRLLQLLTENASRLVGAERSSVFLVDPGTREMMFQVAYQSTDKQAPQGYPNYAEPNAPAHKPEAPGRVPSGGRPQSSRFQPGEFSYFNRSAITVPLRSDPAAGHPQAESEHVLGGLMVLNKQGASFQEEDAELMAILADQAGRFLQVAEMYESSGELFLGVIRALATAIDAKDPSTKGHSQRVSEYAVMIARELGVEENLVNDLRIGSLFHDIGKIGIPDSILLKNGKLTEKEMDYIRIHPGMGVNILSQVKMLEPMTPAILEHHERLDGSGYPAKLTDNEISWMGRIVAVADVFDAMTSDRPYRIGVSRRETLAYLHEHEGIQFDQECVWALEQALSAANQPGTGKTSHLNGD